MKVMTAQKLQRQRQR